MITMKDCNDELSFPYCLDNQVVTNRFNYRLLQFIKKSSYYKANIEEFLVSSENSRNKELAYTH